MKKNTYKFRKKIFKKTTKPIEYVHIENPKSNQDYRQLHFNAWSKVHGVYSGSYLPRDPDKLLKKGWKKIFSLTKLKKAIYERKSTKQQVLFEKANDKGNVDVDHYHWFIGDHKDKINHKFLYNNSKVKCKKGSDETHLLPLDKEKYNSKEIKKLVKNKHFN